MGGLGGRKADKYSEGIARTKEAINEGSLMGYLVAVTSALTSWTEMGDEGKCVMYRQGGGMMADGH